MRQPAHDLILRRRPWERVPFWQARSKKRNQRCANAKPDKAHDDPPTQRLQSASAMRSVSRRYALSLNSRKNAPAATTVNAIGTI